MKKIYKPKDLVDKINKFRNNLVISDSEDILCNIVSDCSKIPNIREYTSELGMLYNDIKLNWAWYCIAKGKDVEKSINVIYNYVSNADRAMHLSNEFRKIILTQSVKASSVIAYIIGKIAREDRDYTHEEVIITNALSKMTDFDFYNFIELVQNHVVKMTGKDVIELSEIDTDNMDSLYYTMQLCAANGIFVAESDLIGENLDDEMLEDCDSVYGGIHYLKTKYCDVLLKYIEDVKQIIPCGKDML